MNVIDIQQLKVTIGIRELLNIKNMQVQAGQRIGLIGKNGSGKTTLFKALLGEMEADVKKVSIRGSVSMLPQLKRTDTHKSGGEISQEYIIEVLAKSPAILLADEPTTNLDTSHVEWVEKKLTEFQGTVLLVSHDRTLIDNLCDTIWELEDGEITEYPGNYTDYLKQKEIERKHQQKEYEKYVQKKNQLERAISQKEQQATNAMKAPKNLTSSEARDISSSRVYYGKVQKGLHQNRKALQTRLEKLEAVERPADELPVKMTLPNERSFKNKTIIRAEKYAGMIGDKKLWEPATFFIKGGDKVGVIGPNASGKTTFLKQLMANNHPQLYLSPAVKIGYFAQNMDILDSEKSILENVKVDSKQDESLVRIILARLGFYGQDVHKKVRVLSGGERVKVSLAKIFVSDSNTIILDEPTNYLDVYALEALEDLLKGYEGTILFVSHDRQFVSEIATTILAIEDEKIEFFDGTFEAYANRSQTDERDLTSELLTKVELEITTVLSKLGDPLISEEEKIELDEKFQKLLKKKRELESQAD